MPPEVELSITLGKRFVRTGIGIRLARYLVRVAFDELGADSIRADVHPENTGALKLLHDSGFRFRDLSGHICNIDGVERHRYTLVRDCWLSRDS